MRKEATYHKINLNLNHVLSNFTKFIVATHIKLGHQFDLRGFWIDNSLRWRVNDRGQTC